METVSFDSFSRSATAGHRPWDLTRLLHSLDTKHGIAHRIQKAALFYFFSKCSSFYSIYDLDLMYEVMYCGFWP